MTLPIKNTTWALIFDGWPEYSKHYASMYGSFIRNVPRLNFSNPKMSEEICLQLAFQPNFSKDDEGDREARLFGSIFHIWHSETIQNSVFEVMYVNGQLTCL